MRDLGHLRQHDRRRAVLVMRQRHRALHRRRLQVAARDHEVEINLGKDLRIDLGPLGLQRHLAPAHVLAAALEDQHHVIRRAAAGAKQHHFHRARRQVVAAAFGRAIHRHHVTAAGLGAETHARRAVPADFYFHFAFPKN